MNCVLRNGILTSPRFCAETAPVDNERDAMPRCVYGTITKCSMGGATGQKRAAEQERREKSTIQSLVMKSQLAWVPGLWMVLCHVCEIPAPQVQPPLPPSCLSLFQPQGNSNSTHARRPGKRRGEGVHRERAWTGFSFLLLSLSLSLLSGPTERGRDEGTGETVEGANTRRRRRREGGLSQG